MRTFFGHPRGLSTLFFTEMWERFGFYGVRALLIFFMTAPLLAGGLGFDTAKAGMVYGMYTAMVYLLSLPGGWLADNILGQRKSVLYGGILIAIGYYALALSGEAAFYSALTLVVLGTGLLKPNVSTIVGGLYTQADQRRDAGFSVFYMGINTGALIAPLVCGWLQRRYNYHIAFSAAGVGMTIGLIQYTLGVKHLGGAGLPPPLDPKARNRAVLGLAILLGTAALIAVLVAFGVLSISAKGISDAFGLFLTILVVVVFGGLLLAPGWSVIERKRLAAILVLFVASAMFWSAFEQAGSTLSLFAQRSTRNSLFGHEFPPAYYQTLNSLFLVIFASVFAAIWLKLGRREPSTSIKFSLGLVFVGLGFAVLVPVANKSGVSPMWLVLVYFLHTIGELCLSPVGLSAMTKLAPARIAALIMGVWFLSISVGEYIGGRVAAVYEAFPLPVLFGTVAAFCVGCGMVLVILNKPMKNLQAGVR